MPKYKIPYKSKLVQYIARYREEDGVKLGVTESKKVCNDSVRTYKNVIYYLARLTLVQRLLLDYMTMRMERNNTVVMDKYMREDFINIVAEQSGRTFSDVSVRKALSTLCKMDLIFRIDRGRYEVNPLFFFSSSEANRIDRIKAIFTADENGFTMEIEYDND